MAMSKQDFIALADVLRNLQPDMSVNPIHEGSQRMSEKHGQQEQWLKTRDALASFCRSQNSNFKRDRWIDYINGDCGPSGGTVKKGGK